MSLPKNGYSSPRGLGDLVIILTWIGIIFTVVITCLDWIEVGLISGMTDGSQNFSIFQILITFAGLTVVLTSGVVFLIWVYRTHLNLTAFGACRLKYTPVSAVVWWFVPLLFYIFPFSAIGEIWRASDPRFTDDLSWKKAPGSPMLGRWQFFWIISDIFSWISLVMLISNDNHEALVVDLVADAFIIVAEVYSIFIVKEITSRQEEKQMQLANIGRSNNEWPYLMPPPIPGRLTL